MTNKIDNKYTDLNALETQALIAYYCRILSERPLDLLSHINSLVDLAHHLHNHFEEWRKDYMKEQLDYARRQQEMKNEYDSSEVDKKPVSH